MTNWTEEQNEIFLAARETQDNLLVEALAGSAKTTTLVKLAQELDGGGIAIAFNKKIADELKERLPPQIESRTLNALGHRVWQQHLGKRLRLFDGKLHSLIIESIEAAPDFEREHLYETLGDIRNICQGSKNHGHVPDALAKKLGGKCDSLLSDDEFFDMLPEEVSDAQRELILSVLARSFQMGLEGTIDFADQLLLPTVMRCVFPMYKNVLVDEAQDLSELNHRMIGKFAKRRIIAVGDSYQAIYAFRGAHREGMPLLSERFSMRVMHLSTSFRCPQAICDHVRWHVPRIRHWDGNKKNPGTVRHLQAWSLSEIPDGAAVICRNNAPLFRMAIRMLKEGRRPLVWGNDVAAALVKILEGLGAPSMRQGEAIKALFRYKEAKLAKIRRDSAKKSLDERVECLLVFIKNAETLGGAIALAKNVFNGGGKIDLCTGHKSKGHEWEDVFVLDELLFNDDAQDCNLRYVIATRSKHNLTYITSEGYVEQ